jgi:transposase
MGRDVCRRHVFPGKKGGACVGKTKRGKGTKLMVVADGKGIPLGVHLASATPNEVTLIETTLRQVAVPRQGRGRPRKNPTRLIYDKAADSDPLRDRLAKRGIELICPHRVNRTKPKRQDGRKLRRYKRRWKIERSIAWIANFRRLVVRYERKITMFYAFVHVACLLIAVRQL